MSKYGLKSIAFIGNLQGEFLTQLSIMYVILIFDFDFLF